MTTRHYAIRSELGRMIKTLWQQIVPEVEYLGQIDSPSIAHNRPRIYVSMEVQRPYGPVIVSTPISGGGRPGVYPHHAWLVSVEVSAITPPDFELHEEVCAKVRKFFDQLVDSQTESDSVFYVDAISHNGETSALDTESNVYITTIAYEAAVALKQSALNQN